MDYMYIVINVSQNRFFRLTVLTYPWGPCRGLYMHILHRYSSLLRYYYIRLISKFRMFELPVRITISYNVITFINCETWAHAMVVGLAAFFTLSDFLCDPILSDQSKPNIWRNVSDQTCQIVWSDMCDKAIWSDNLIRQSDQTIWSDMSDQKIWSDNLIPQSDQTIWSDDLITHLIKSDQTCLLLYSRNTLDQSVFLFFYF